jgi:putative oxidoreductase
MPRGQKAACLQKLPAQLAHFAGEGMNIAALEQGQLMNIVDLFKPFRVSLRVSAGLFILRLVAGLAFIFHGYGKITNPFGWMPPESGVPGILQALAALSEFGGGLAWMLGLLTPLASFGLACTMAVAVWTHAVVLGDPFVPKGPGGSYELASIYLCVAILLLLCGPGRFSLDRAVFGRKTSDRS